MVRCDLSRMLERVGGSSDRWVLYPQLHGMSGVAEMHRIANEYNPEYVCRSSALATPALREQCLFVDVVIRTQSPAVLPKPENTICRCLNQFGEEFNEAGGSSPFRLELTGIGTADGCCETATLATFFAAKGVSQPQYSQYGNG